MGGTGLSISSIGATGPGGAVTMNIGVIRPTTSTPGAAGSNASSFQPTQADVVISFSDAALRAFTLDAATSPAAASASSKLADDLAALALLALLERNRQSDAPGAAELAAAALAIRAYVAIQALDGN